MRNIPYGVRFVIALTSLLLSYWGIALMLHQPVQLSALIVIPVTIFCTERLWTLLEWVSPILGVVSIREQERTQKRLIEHELSRSLRYGSRLVVAAIREKKRISSHVVAQHIRRTDSVLRSSAGYLLVLMPDTDLAQARYAFERLSGLRLIKDVVAMDEKMFKALAESRSSANSKSPQKLSEICIQALNAKLASLPVSVTENAAPVIYNFLGSYVADEQKKLLDLQCA